MPLLTSRKAAIAEPELTSVLTPPRQVAKRPRVLVCDPIDPAGLEILGKTAVIDYQPGIN
ncbi:MAG: hypothetical protein M5U34_43520 [Chloroflexi bacterium]|nr:hypothetical protein [Chloroflexota bacterium]